MCLTVRLHAHTPPFSPAFSMDLSPFLFFLLLLTSTYPYQFESRLHDNFTDLAALMAFKDRFSDPFGILSANWSTKTSFCSWIGVACSRQHQRVAALYLYNVSLQGTISPHVANLSFLSYLDLTNTSLIGNIPDTLGQLPRLKILFLDRNCLTGSIPSSLFNISFLVEIYLGRNNLSGTIPSNQSISMLPRLQIASLGINQLTGQVPASFARCLDLRVLSLAYNNLSGTVPAELGNLRELRLLYLSDNQLTGKIPSSLGNLTKLSKLEISQNNLEGEIPKELGNLSNLQTLLLGVNSLTGSIPSSLLNASMITIFEVVLNNLTGSVPATLGEYMPMLNFLNVAHNRLAGNLNFITSLSSCRNMEYIGLSQNELEGSVPNSVGNLSVNIQYFDIGKNQIKGNIPAELGNLSALLLLDLESNELTGAIPPAVTRLQRLQQMYLGNNRISGSIPSQLGLMVSLSYLDFGGNKLSGAIPDLVGNLTGLQHLSLAANTLSSNIPHSLWSLRSLIELNLSHNSLYGSIPLEVSNLNTLDTLDLSKNRLSGNIASALGELQMLTCLDLSVNSFHGQIPPSLGGLINVKYVNLSTNFLSGAIPKSLANLHYLDSLDLSFNKLEGQIPKGRVFSNLTVSSLEGNTELCGAPQLDFPPCSAITVNFHSRKKHLLKYIVPVIVLVVLALSCFFLISTIYRRRKMRSLVSTEFPHLGDHILVSYRDLVRATNNFSQANLLGRGSFGSVFTGCLDDGLSVAVKVLNLEAEGASKSFDVECQALCRLRHRNLIKIISICSNLDFKALILQFMPNGSLEQWLYSKNCCLNLLQRLNIMVDVSSALEYLHHHHPQVVLHCDIKPSNVLLDEEMVAHVSDFGIAKLLLGDSSSIATASTPGTLGYIAPEYGSTGKVSKMGDVYSFGILLLEAFTQKKAN